MPYPEELAMSADARRVIQLTQLSENRATRLIVEGENILLVRQGDTVRAYGADCPHAGGPLEEGALCNGRIVCPWHKGSFDVATGKVLEPPALFDLDCYPVTVAGDDVLVTPRKVDKPKTGTTTDKPKFVIVGSGAAGAAACTALRANGFSGHITLIGEESPEPYDRTALSKFVPSAEMSPTDVPALLPPHWLEKQQIDRIEASVIALDVAQRSIHLADGQELTYDTALLATGSVPELPSIKGCDLKSVYLLRNLRDAAALFEAAGNAHHVAIIGSGFIGLEVASALRKRGAQVTVVSSGRVPFERQFGSRLGMMFQHLHESQGVVFRFNEKLSEIAGDASNSQARAIVLESGARLEIDAVLIGVGVSPATGFLKGLSLQKDGGVIVNAGMQAAPGLYAAGDIAAFPLYENQEPLRIEHWRVAQQHAVIAAQNMCGARNRYQGVPYFWTYHYGKSFEYLGHATSWDDLEIDGSPEDHQFLALYVKDHKVIAVLACQREAATARLIGSLQAGLSADEALQLAKDE